MSVDPTPHFPESYAAARRAFLRAAEARGARIASYPVPARGPGEEELAVDVAWLGPEAPERALVVSSGIHGVEGFAGSAVQHRLLAEPAEGPALPPDAGLLLVHALNPYGFAHGRRVNERNVDLNRNFLRHPEEHVPNPGYDALAPWLNPERLDEEVDAGCREALLAYAREHGFPRLQEVLTCGQYAHPEGVQFGGEAEEASNRILRRVAGEETRGAARVLWLDLHTGLGPYGEPELIAEVPPMDPMYRRGRAWFGDRVRSTLSGESVSARLHGVMERGLREAVPEGCELTAFAAEFGTFEPTRVFWAMRADNWLRHHGDPDSARGRAIREELLEVFRPADPAWRTRVLERAAALLRAGGRGLAAEPEAGRGRAAGAAGGPAPRPERA